MLTFYNFVISGLISSKLSEIAYYIIIYNGYNGYLAVELKLGFRVNFSNMAVCHSYFHLSRYQNDMCFEDSFRVGTPL